MSARKPEAADAEYVAELEQRVADLEAAVGALARTAIRNGAALDVVQLPFNRRVDNRTDAALIRKAAR